MNGCWVILGAIVFSSPATAPSPREKPAPSRAQPAPTQRAATARGSSLEEQRKAAEFVERYRRKVASGKRWLFIITAVVLGLGGFVLAVRRAMKNRKPDPGDEPPA